jgi:hypothetical protein
MHVCLAEILPTEEYHRDDGESMEMDSYHTSILEFQPESGPDASTP